MASGKPKRPRPDGEESEQADNLLVDYEGLPEEGEINSGDPINFWEQKQRELVTSVVDYNLGALADLIRTKRIDVSPRYQRRFRWDTKRQSRLIESFLMNVPVPPIFLNGDKYGDYSVIDGKQRLMAIYSLFQGKLVLQGLKVFSDINGKTFDDLPPELQAVIKVRPTLRAVIVLRQSDPDIKFEVFKRLNTGGVRLNAQEIRNSTYPGPLNDLILELSEHTRFHSTLGIENKNRSALYQEMRDAELVLRFFTFRKTWESFSGGMMRQMDHFMMDNQKMPQGKLKDAEADFLGTLAGVEAAFGEYAFQRWQPEKKVWRKAVLASLYDAEMFALRGLDAELLFAKRSEIRKRFKTLFEKEHFRATIDAATNTPSSFRSRITMVRDLVTGVIGS